MLNYKKLCRHKNVLELLSHKQDYDIDLYQHICDYSCHSRADLPYCTLSHMILLIYIYIYTHTHTVLGKVFLKVMHYNIVLLPKKVTNYVT